MASDLEEIMKEIKTRAAMQPRIKTYAEDIVFEGKEYAEKISPVETGDFKDAWSVRYFPPRFDGDMPLFQLQNDDEGAVSIEYGTKDTPPHHTAASTRIYMAQLAERDEYE
jgi:hypothetical protein